MDESKLTKKDKEEILSDTKELLTDMANEFKKLADELIIKLKQ